MSCFSLRALATWLALGGMVVVVSCTGGKGVKWAESSAPAVRVNQLGYLSDGAKWASVRTTESRPLPARLRSGDKVLWSGQSVVFGRDEASGDHIHWVEFTAFQNEGTELILHVGQEKSFPFVVSSEVYRELPLDALKYFYHNRSGTPIIMPYAVDQSFTRPAGHLSDQKVPCWNSQECSYFLDVSGGWYDAGDYGKYVVNGGISAWTLLSLYERLDYLSGTAAAWGDRTLNIPESGNGVPDLLDEARFEVEFLLKMQVPEGQELAGMAHHKIHDHTWSDLAIEPPEQADNRGLHPPSTAATLNLAAVAAQSARVFRKWDPEFANRCLTSAQVAYRAAVAHPDRLAPELDKQGGGPYADKFVSDEFFWAESELFLSTGEQKYWEKLKTSPHFRAFPTSLQHPDGGSDGDGVSGSMSWQSTAGLGWISLAMAPSELSDSERDYFRHSIVAAGETYLRAIAREGYRLPMNLGKSKKYPWGSNSFVLNNMIVLSLAYDFTHKREYADGVVQGMDYLLGRNGMAQSYLTGYGSVPLTQPHHRFWANSLNESYPKPPPGAVSGGPNSSLQDPQTKKSGLSPSLPPQKCFVDHIDAWSVNEVTINWNAPLAWVAIFLREWDEVVSGTREVGQ